MTAAGEGRGKREEEREIAAAPDGAWPAFFHLSSFVSPLER
jgi:hypothetical protein